MEEAAKSGAKMNGHPSGFYWTYDSIQTDMAAAVPIDKPIKAGNGVYPYSIGGQRALVIDYYGGYDKLGEAHGAMEDSYVRHESTSDTAGDRRIHHRPRHRTRYHPVAYQDYLFCSTGIDATGIR